jgi:hypothetical protein
MIITYPAVSIMAAAGMERIIQNIGSRKQVAAALLLLAYMAASLAIVHPYYLDYYNEIAGGPGNVYASKMLIVGYWGEGLSAAMDYVNQNAGPGSTLRVYAEPMHVLPPARPDIKMLDAFVPNYVYENGLVDTSKYYQCSPNGWCIYEPDKNDTKADYVITNTYYEWYMDPGISQKLSGYSKVFSADVLGAGLAAVYKR